MDFTRDGLARAGFKGFVRIADLKARGGCSCVPPCRDIYTVIRCSSAPPTFLPQSVGGHHKGKDPTVAAEMLDANWVPGAMVLYIGKAGDEGQETTLNRRVSAYMSFGRGARAAHWGGRLVWQLADSDELLLAWRKDDRPSESEQRMLADFVRQYGRRPFANLRDQP